MYNDDNLAVTWQPTPWDADEATWVDWEHLTPGRPSKKRRKAERKERKRRMKKLRQMHLPDTGTGKLRLIFCDFDGVLNRHSSGPYHLKPELVGRLDRLARATGAVVVVSSWWRCIGVDACRRDLADAGFTGTVIGRTPWLGHNEQWDAWERGTEIQAVLDHLADRVESYVILDDHDRMGKLLPNLVQTVASEGLTNDCVERARAILVGQPPRHNRATGVYELVDA